MPEASCAERVPVAHTPPGGCGDVMPAPVPIEVRRRRDGAQTVSEHVGCTARLDRIGDVE